MENPAKISIELSRLFPPGVVAAEVTVPVDPALLRPGELQLIAHCAEKRVQDFTAGRACAHAALEGLGLTDVSVLSGEQREPLWPASIVGSITHTHGFGAAVVARAHDVQAVGIDCEVADSVDEELWSRICSPCEIDRLRGLPPAERGSHAALIFAAKEAFYKCQFPLTRQWVGFEDVVIEPVDWPCVSGTLRILPRVALPLSADTVAGLHCRFQFRECWVLVGVAKARPGVPM